MKILVCGSRHFNDYPKLCYEMDDLSEKYDFDNNQPITIISGAAKGADTLGERYADECGWTVERYPAAWETHGKRAGPIRNAQMLREGKPDVVVAFLAPNSRGTKNMIEISRKAGVPVEVIEIASSALQERAV